LSLAVRFPDFDGRTDASGRVIPDEFVVFEPLASQIESLEDGMRLVWSQVEDDFADTWDQSSPPVAQD